MKETNEQQVEELEKEFYDLKKCCEWNNYNYKKVPAYTDKNSGIKEKAKQLKEDIKKGCKKEFNVIKYKKESREYKAGILGEGECCTATNLCPKCQELINRLNKIIG